METEHAIQRGRYRVFFGALRTIFTEVCQDFQAQLVEMDGADDHAHLLIECPPKVPVSPLVNSLKGVSSRLLRQAQARPPQALEGRALVTELLLSILRWHRAVALSISGLNAGAFRALG